MIGVKEGALQSIRTVMGGLSSPDAYRDSPYSVSSQLALQVAMGLADERFRKADHMQYRLVSDLIYYANNYFDIGLAAKGQIFHNKPHQFVATETVHRSTWHDMEQAASRLADYDPSLSPLIERYVEDGEILARSRNQMSHTDYRELDSGLSALLVFGAVGGEAYLAELGLDGSRKCSTPADLRAKYDLFMVRDKHIDSLNQAQKSAVGLQSIEMILACLDDQWGGVEDAILGLGRDSGPGESSKELIPRYRAIAIETGFTPRILDIISLLVHTHKIKLNMLPKEGPYELSEISRHWPKHNVKLLREWLHKTSLLEEMFR